MVSQSENHRGEEKWQLDNFIPGQRLPGNSALPQILDSEFMGNKAQRIEKKIKGGFGKGDKKL
jgi:hypothetical protein